MEEIPKPHQILGLNPGASPEEVKQAYRDLVKVWHPDRFAHDDRLRLLAQDKLKEINGAYELIRAQTFEDSIAPEPTAAAETGSAPEASKTVGKSSWLRVALILFAMGVVMAAILIWANGRSGKPVAAVAAAVPDAFPTNRDYALKFNLRKSHIELATTGSLSDTFTVECWVLTHRPKQVGTILSSCAPDNFGFDIKFREGRRFHADIGDGARWLSKMANARFAYQRDTWYHLAYVVTSDRYQVYVDGRLVAKNVINPAGNPLLYDDTHRLWLGADGSAPDDMEGSIAELRIWRTARTETQIVGGMNSALQDEEPGLMGNWRFTEGAGTTAADSSGHGFTATLVGNVTWSTNTPARLNR